MFPRLHAIVAVLLSGGHVPTHGRIECPYCGATHTDERGTLIDREQRPLLSAGGALRCRSCGRPLDHDECTTCDRGFGDDTGVQEEVA